MAERFKSIFFTILSLTVVWFIIILLCLSQSNNIEQWSAGSIHRPLVSSNQVVDFIKVDDPQSDSLVNIASRHNNGYSNNHIKSSHHIQLPLSLNYLKNLQAKHKGISAAGTLFYQLDLNPKELSNATIISKVQHDKETLRLGFIDSPADQYIKAEGERLFAFNLLVSNRIGLYRPLPDTRNLKCHHLIEDSPAKEQDPNNHLPKQQNTSISMSHHHIATTIKLQASIIICYYNEAPSALLRTIYSVLKRSPIELLKEIIVVDDSSNHEYNYNKIKAFVKSDLVKLVRTDRREGLIRARLFGADLAQGDVLIFLDSHVEANIGWLEPLLKVIQDNSTTICCPMIDLINSETLIYSSSPMVRGGLNWALNFKWDSVPSSELKTYDDFVKPIISPTMAGGLYAIDRHFFKRLGEYDQGMDLWGGENIELSLRAWMCGGRIVILSCSRVGHIFRKRRPYGPEPDQPDSLLLNSHRTARVWLDDYIYKFYEANPDAKYLMSGDISQRVEIRNKLGCRNFSWYLDNIYPTLKKELRDENEINSNGKILLKKDPNLFNLIPKHSDSASTKRLSNLHARSINNRMQRQASLDHHNAMFSNSSGVVTRIVSERYSFKHGLKYNKLPPTMVAQFQIQSTGSNYCIESMGGFLAKGFTRLVLNYCAEVKRNSQNEIMIDNSTILNQLWTETDLHDYRLGDNQCLDLLKNLPLLKKCHNMRSFQEWTHHNKSNNTSISNLGATLCLGVERIQVSEPIIVTICDIQSNERFNHSLATRQEFSKSPRKFKHTDRLYPSWRTSSTHIKRRFLNVGSMKVLRLNQRWNLLFVKDSTGLSQEAQGVSVSPATVTINSTKTLKTTTEVI